MFASIFSILLSIPRTPTESLWRALWSLSEWTWTSLLMKPRYSSAVATLSSNSNPLSQRDLILNPRASVHSEVHWQESEEEEEEEDEVCEGGPDVSRLSTPLKHTRSLSYDHTQYQLTVLPHLLHVWCLHTWAASCRQLAGSIENQETGTGWTDGQGWLRHARSGYSIVQPVFLFSFSPLNLVMLRIVLFFRWNLTKLI